MDTLQLGIFLVFVICAGSASFVHQNFGGGGQDAPGRIQEFDQLLIEHGMSITKGQKLKRLARELTKMAETLNYDPELEKYYVEVVGFIDGVGADALKEERDRLNMIITSSSDRGKAGEAEIDYSVKRRNIIEAFVDASANYLLGELDFKFGNMGNYDPNAENNFMRDDF